MLKIKDNVDLKELEKYGFVNDEIDGRKVKIKKMMTKEKWLRSLVPAVIFIVKEEYVPCFFFGSIKLKVYFI